MDNNQITIPVCGVAPLPGTLEIFKFNDVNGDGIYESGAPDFETPLESWNFTVAGGPTATPGPYSTDGDGLITISNLTAGDYTVTEMLQAGWTVTTANPQTGTVSDSVGKRLNFGNLQIIVPVVGGEVYPINKVTLLMSWIVLFTAVLAGAIIVARRRLRSYR
jgi:hypothetical protein